MNISSNDILKNISNKNEIKNILSKEIVQTDAKVPIGAKAKDESIKTLLDSLFKDLSLNLKTKDSILKILQDKCFAKDIKETSSNLKSIIADLKNDKTLLKSTNILDKLILDIKNIDAKALQKQIKQSGLFLESKLLNLDKKQSILNPKDEILYDIKANLLQLKDELSKTSNPSKTDTLSKVDKVLTSINYYQLASFSSGSNILYLPLLWDGLDEGQISIKKLKQKRFFCEINLKLKDYGNIDLLIMLFDKIDINISIFTRSDEFLKRVKENLLSLKQGINSLGLIPTNIYLYDSLKDDKIKRDTKSYVNGEQIGESVNIHV